jgi:hypothetical protein
LDTDARPLDSLTTYTNEFEGVGLTGSKEVNLVYWTDGGFSWQNVFSRVYTNDPNNPERIDDVKRMASLYPDSAFTISVSNGISKRLNVDFFNHADLNRDRKVDGLDYAIWANEYGKDNVSDPNRFGSYVGADVNDLGAYADIDRSGDVDVYDFNDLGDFSYEWLWDAQDANTW